MNPFDDKELPLPCLSCGKKTHKTVGWIRSNSGFTCACGAVIKFESEKLKTLLAESDAKITELLYKIKGITRH